MLGDELVLLLLGGLPAGGDYELPISIEGNHIYRRVVGQDGDGIRRAVVPSQGVFDDWAVASGVAYEYQVHTVGLNGAERRGEWTA